MSSRYRAEITYCLCASNGDCKNMVLQQGKSTQITDERVHVKRLVQTLQALTCSDSSYHQLLQNGTEEILPLTRTSSSFYSIQGNILVAISFQACSLGVWQYFVKKQTSNYIKRVQFLKFLLFKNILITIQLNAYIYIFNIFIAIRPTKKKWRKKHGNRELFRLDLLRSSDSAPQLKTSINVTTTVIFLSSSSVLHSYNFLTPFSSFLLLRFQSTNILSS